MSDDYIIDFISGFKVKATPEEIEAVQVVSKRLVDEFEYDRTYIQTRPQFKIKQSPSGKAKYPVDIAVFKNDGRNYEDLFMIVECKRKTREDGLKQLYVFS